MIDHRAISAEQLHDYFAGELPVDEERELEEHVFDCNVCGQLFERVGALSAALQRLVPPIVSRRKLRALVERGVRLSIHPVHPGAETSVEFSEGLELLIFELHAELGGVQRMDFEIGAMHGPRTLVFADVPFDRARGEVLVACQRHYLTEFEGDTPIFRLYAVEPSERRMVGEYIVEHRLPG